MEPETASVIIPLCDSPNFSSYKQHFTVVHTTQSCFTQKGVYIKLMSLSSSVASEASGNCDVLHVLL